MTWSWVAATTAINGFLVMVLVLGATVFRTRQWDEAFTEIARWEAERRGLDRRKLTPDERHAVDVMVGEEPARADDTCSPFRLLVVHTLSILSGYGDARSLAAHVVERRESLLGDALQRQLRQVARFRTVRDASRAWVVQKRLRRIEVAVRGVVWLLPRALNEITAIVKEYTTKLGVVSVFVGALYWRLVRNQDGSGPSAPDVIALLTKLVLPGLVLWVIGVLLFRVIVAHAGSPRSWPRRAVIAVGLAVAVGIALSAGLDLIGDRLGPVADKWRVQMDSNDPTTFRLVTALFLGGLLWIARLPAANALDKKMLMSGRVGALAATATLVAISIPMAGLVAAGTVASPLRTAMYAMILAACILVFVSLVYKGFELIDRHRTLVRDGVRVPRRGFSWWLIGAWILATITGLVLGVIPANTSNSTTELALLMPALFATLGMFPIAIVTALFVRRVNTHFEVHKTADRPEF